jgi:hypothetical protein
VPSRGHSMLPPLLLASLVAAVVGALVATLVAGLFFRQLRQFIGERVLAAPAAVLAPLAPPQRTTTSAEGVIKELRALHRLETASFTAETIVESDNPGSPVQNFLYRDRMLLIAHGRVIAGVDLSTLSPEDIAVNGQTITIYLRPPQILSVTLDNSRTRVYDRSLGLITRGDPNLEGMLRVTAEEAILRSACQANVLNEAGRQARIIVTRMFSLAGFSSVVVNVPGGVCA